MSPKICLKDDCRKVLSLRNTFGYCVKHRNLSPHRKEAQKRSVQKNKTHYQLYGKKHYQNNKDKYKERNKEWRNRNLDYVKERSKKYQQENREKLLVKGRERSRTPSARFSAAKSSSKRRGLSFDIEFEHYRELISTRCYYCAGNLPETGIGLDRINNDLGYSLTNVVPCCADCNYLRADIFSVEETKALVDFIKTMRGTDTPWPK